MFLTHSHLCVELFPEDSSYRKVILAEAGRAGLQQVHSSADVTHVTSVGFGLKPWVTDSHRTKELMGTAD